MKRASSFIAGLLTGLILFGGGVAYAAEQIAERSRHTVYVDGRAVELEAYTIEGSNYVKLRDVGKLLDFNVYWDGAVQIDSAAPYTGEAPVPEQKPVAEPAPAPSQPEPGTDWSLEASASVFDAVYTRDAYNALRQTVLDRNRILAGEAYSYRHAALSETTATAMRDVSAALGNWPSYSMKTELDGSSWFAVKYPSSYQDAADYCTSFIQSLGDRSDDYKVRELAYFVCNHLTYRADTTATPRTALCSDAVSAGNCMSYAHCFAFLCGQAEIPCIMVHSDEHQWNQVYVNGQWWNVDVSALDAGDSTSVRGHQTILYRDNELQNSIYRQSQPALTAFARELLVPGSSK